MVTTELRMCYSDLVLAYLVSTFQPAGITIFPSLEHTFFEINVAFNTYDIQRYLTF